MIVVIDYGMGNLRSVQKALQHLGHAAEITSDPARIASADRVVLPGVGAFGAAMRNIERPECGNQSLKQAILCAAASGRPFLGICLGMQLLFRESNELGCFQGLDLVPGRVRRFEFNGRAAAEELKIPHMGWNALEFPRASLLFEGLPGGSMVYFVHSYYCIPDEAASAAATADHGGRFCAGLESGNVFATQFHPEKSGAVGMRILDNFARS